MASSPRICPACQTSNPPLAAFCFSCGKPLEQKSVTSELLHQRYHLLQKVGTGGFGAVYQAEDTLLGGRLVAVKEMTAQQSGLSTQENSEATEAFKKEALLLAELMHPNLAHIYDHFYDSRVARKVNVQGRSFSQSVWTGITIFVLPPKIWNSPGSRSREAMCSSLP